MRVLVTRPEPAATATAARLARLGHEAIVAPLLTVRALEWEWPEMPVEALAVTSANAFAGLRALPELPLFAVGDATAAAARRHGVRDVRAPGGDVAALWAAVRAAGFARALHLAGRERTAAAVPGGLTVEVRAVYAADLAEALPDDMAAALRAAAVDWTLLYSARTAGGFARLVDAAGIARAALSIAAISSAALAAAGRGWRAAVAAATPDEAGLFAAAGLAPASSDGAG